MFHKKIKTCGQWRINISNREIPCKTLTQSGDKRGKFYIFVEFSLLAYTKIICAIFAKFNLAEKEPKNLAVS